MNEIKIRSGLKSLIWRIAGVIILATITYAYTRKWIQTGLITVIHHGVFLFVFYFHERFWLRLENEHGEFIKFKKSLLKMFIYETVCGNLILGTITYIITGSWKQMGLITITYIGFKHLCYVFNEFIWDKITWGKE